MFNRQIPTDPRLGERRSDANELAAVSLHYTASTCELSIKIPSTHIEPHLGNPGVSAECNPRYEKMESKQKNGKPNIATPQAIVTGGCGNSRIWRPNARSLYLRSASLSRAALLHFQWSTNLRCSPWFTME